MNDKTKEPLFAALLSVLIVGLGQMYLRRFRRGAAFLLVYTGLCLLTVFALIKLKSVPSDIHFALLMGWSICGVVTHIYAVVDAYYCAKAYNKNKYKSSE